MIGIYDTEEEKFLEVPESYTKSAYPAYDYKLPEFVMAPDGLIYVLDDNSACGDPECCGDFEQYYKRSDRFVAKEM